ncbi:MAG: carboxypeptidase-like regulatory domain-containing protein [Gammaproteobacteria bacterium]|nr:carboxypeptidase-like regulatory domain-containing protein [Gammaproteobacteria bacterium]
MILPVSFQTGNDVIEVRVLVNKESILLRNIIFILSAIFLTVPAHGEETGFKGKVLRGPIYPGPSIEGKPDEAPFRAVFRVLNAANKVVAHFESDEEGRFEVLLPAGTYTIIAEKSAPILFPQRQQRKVTVPKGGFADVTLRFDTGMR